MPTTKQIILLDKDGTLVDSSGSLFNAGELSKEGFIKHFPFLESIFKALLHEQKLNAPITFHGVETKHLFLPGYYNYIFSSIYKNEEKLIRWEILDATKEYEQIKKNQQINHEQKF